MAGTGAVRSSPSTDEGRGGGGTPGHGNKGFIRDKALALGFDVVGFASPDLGEQAKRELADYLTRGYHGDMGWLAAKADRRAAPRTLWPAVRSVVVLARSEEHTSELQSLMRISYAVFCLKKKTNTNAQKYQQYSTSNTNRH